MSIQKFVAMIFSVLAVAACAESHRSAEPGTKQQALGSGTVCNQGASNAPVVPSWGTIVTGTLNSETTLSVRLKSPFTQRVRLDVQARGLDARDITRKLWEGEMSADGAQTVAFRLSDLPVQSTGRKSTARLVATIVRSEQEHLAGVRVQSSPLAYTFNSNYAQVVLYGEDQSFPQVFSSAPASLAQVSAALAPVAQSLLNVSGRVWNGSAFVAVSQLGGVGSTYHIAGGSVVFSDVDDKYLTKFGPVGGPVVNQGGARVCFAHRQSFIDEGRGESVYAGEGPAAWSRARLLRASDGAMIWDGFLNEAGCTPQLQLGSYTGYSLLFQSKLETPDPGAIRVPIKSGSDFADTATSFSTLSLPMVDSPATITLGVWDEDRRVRAAAALSQVLRTSTLGIPAGDYGTQMGLCTGLAAGQPEAWTACFDFDQRLLWLGPNKDGTHNTDWKFVIAHEFGHGIQGAMKAAVRPEYSEPTSALICSCNHVPDENERTHCLQSRENLRGAQNEGFGHGVAAAVWNPRSTAECKFVYYKQIFTQSGAFYVIKAPPYAVDCTQQVRWLENNCLTEGGNVLSDKGVEWDWLNWQRALDVDANATSLADFGAIYRGACGGVSCNNSTVAPTMSQLKAASDTYHGVGSPRAARFRTLAFLYGTDH
jgi:hypothetical protein